MLKLKLKILIARISSKLVQCFIGKVKGAASPWMIKSAKVSLSIFIEQRYGSDTGKDMPKNLKFKF